MLDYTTRARLPVIVLTPSGHTRTLRTSEMLQRVAEVWHARTPLLVQAVDAGRANACEGRLVCMAAEVPQAPVLMVVSALPMDVEDLVSVVLLDPTRAREAPPGVDAEAWAADHALLGPELRRPVRRGEDFARLMSAALDAAQPALTRRGLGAPLGRVDVRAPRDAEVRLGGQRVNGSVTWRGVPPGEHLITVTRADGAASTHRATVRPGEVASVAVALIPEPGRYRTARRATLWGAAAIAVAGAAVLVAGALESPAPTACWADCDAELVRFGAPSDPGPLQPSNGRGVPALPLGAGLLGFGAGAGLGTLFIGDDDDLPWLPWLLGVAGAGAAAGLSAAAR